MTRRRLTVFVVLSTLLGLASLAAAIDASSRRALDGETLDAFVGRTGSSELALSSTSRWLRHPGLAEPAAGCQDQPPCLDTDPGGLALAPPRTLFGASVSARLERLPAEDTP